MKMRRAKAILLLLPVLFCVACPARWHFVLMNATDRTLHVKFNDGESAFVVGSGARKRVLYPPAQTQQDFYSRRLEVRGDDGTLLYDASATNLFWRLKEEDAVQYPNVYVLLTTNAAYTVPDVYRDTWEDHLDQIMAIHEPR